MEEISIGTTNCGFTQFTTVALFGRKKGLREREMVVQDGSC